MMNRSVRKMVFAAAVTLFVCLFLSGSPRLIAGREELPETRPLHSVCAVPSYLTNGTVRHEENGCASFGEQTLQRRPFSVVVRCQDPVNPVLSDANGNVLGCRSYMHEVYQAFVLSDGFA
ncbi:MAG: hypothetical protein IJD60_06735 [Clostridia bacterium]|nr:hypothetical protein [Clostridia bacterium]